MRLSHPCGFICLQQCPQVFLVARTQSGKSKTSLELEGLSCWHSSSSMADCSPPNTDGFGHLVIELFQLRTTEETLRMMSQQDLPDTWFWDNSWELGKSKKSMKVLNTCERTVPGHVLMRQAGSWTPTLSRWQIADHLCDSVPHETVPQWWTVRAEG